MARDLDPALNPDADRPGPRAARWVVTTLGWLVAAVVLFQLIGAFRAPRFTETPALALKTLTGETVDLASLRGQTVVVNFWATWCGPCRLEIPSFSAFAQANPNVPVLGVAVDGTPPQLQAAAKKLGIRYPVLIADAHTQRAWGVTTLPTTFVIGPNGEVKHAHTGILLRPQLSLLVNLPF